MLKAISTNPEVQAKWHSFAASEKELASYGACEGTLVFLMGLNNLNTISAGLIKGGKPANTPTAVAKYGTIKYTYSTAADGEYRDIAHPINSDTRNMIQTLILEQYEAMNLGDIDATAPEV